MDVSEKIAAAAICIAVSIIGKVIVDIRDYLKAIYNIQDDLKHKIEGFIDNYPDSEIEETAKDVSDIKTLILARRSNT